ncbi:MAG: YfcE family phosphodiesterase [Candidatus Acidiferrales bacterium]
MKIVIVSDIHGNYDALSELPESCDELWVLGDLVNYGPQPAEVVDFVLAKASLVVRGNHDQCIGHGDDPQCSPRFRDMAEATRQFSSSVVTSQHKLRLRSFPPRLTAVRGHTRFFLCHATPSDPFYEYRDADSEKWVNDCRSLGVDVVLVGHTHIPFIRRLNGQILINPGSLGQPKTGSPCACYAVWENGHVSLRSYAYPVDKTVEKIRMMPIARNIQQNLIAVLESGGLSCE